MRLMHCSSLNSLKGLHLLPRLTELNASSNAILSMAHLESATRLVTLNLSCNKITQVFNLGNLAGTLKKLILSHNRIINLPSFKDLP